MALIHTATTAQGSYCEAGNRKALPKREETVPEQQEQQSLPQQASKSSLALGMSMGLCFSPTEFLSTFSISKKKHKSGKSSLLKGRETQAHLCFSLNKVNSTKPIQHQV